MSLRARRWFDEDSATVPWLVTFSDLLMLLITMFVMRLAMMSVENEKVAQSFGVVLEKEVASQQATVAVAKDLRRVLTAELGAATVQEGPHAVLEFPNEVNLAVLERGVGLSIGGGRFLPGKRDLSLETIALLAKLTPILAQQRALIRVEGHTDSTPIATPEFASNWELSAARAISVAEVLMRNGLPGKRISTVGYSDTRPLASNETEEGRAQNRRVELLLEPSVK